MPFQTFTPPIGPSPGTKWEPTIAANRADFGDGYVQASPRGINHIKAAGSLTWNGVLEQDMKAITAFFTEHGGYIPFWYQPHGFDAPVKWVCRKWSTSAQAPWRVSAEFEESFIPET